MTPLTPTQLTDFLTAHPTWTQENQTLTRTFTFPGFLAAIAFVNQVAELAESAAHHPDIDIRYNRVRLTLTTHDAHGLTTNDTALATSLDQIP